MRTQWNHECKTVQKFRFLFYEGPVPPTVVYHIAENKEHGCVVGRIYPDSIQKCFWVGMCVCVSVYLSLTNYMYTHIHIVIYIYISKYIYIQSEWKSFSHVWFFVTPWTIAHQVPLSMEFFRQGYWSGLSFPSPEDLPHSGIKPRYPAL